MLRKMSIVPVALVALYLFGCNFQNSKTEPLSDKETIVIALDKTAEPEPFSYVEEMPVFPGGDAELLKFLNDNVDYPERAKENNIQGTVYIRFVVTAQGTIGEVRILRGVDPELDAEAVRVIQLLPAFTPGKQGGVAVPVWYTVPITFRS